MKKSNNQLIKENYEEHGDIPDTHILCKHCPEAINAGERNELLRHLDKHADKIIFEN